MSDKMLQQAEEAAVEEQEVVLEPVEDELEALRASIAYLEEKEALLTEKLCEAKAKGLTQQSDRCRALLQKVVIQKRQKKDLLQEAEAKKLADELDGLADELEAEFDPKPFAEEEELEYNYRAKAKRLSLISRMIGFVGVFACLVGSLVYLILTQVETMNLPFEPLSLIITGGAAVVFVVIAVIVGASANNYKRYADEVEADRLEKERQLAEQERAELLALARLNAVSEAYSIETKQDMQNAKPKRALFGKVKMPEVPEKVKNNVHKIIPVAAICTAVVTAAAISSAQKKNAAAKRSAAVRKEFFNWLG